MRDSVITGLSRLLGLLARSVMRHADDSGLPAHPKRILILKPCCLGDVLMSTPLVDAVWRGFPEAELDYAVGAWSRPMVAGNPHIDRVVTVPDRWSAGSLLAVARELRGRHYDLVFVP